MTLSNTPFIQSPWSLAGLFPAHDIDLQKKILKTGSGMDKTAGV